MRVFRVLPVVVGLLFVVFVSSCIVLPIAPINQTHVTKMGCVEQAKKWEGYIKKNNKVFPEHYFQSNQLIITAPLNSDLFEQVAKEYTLEVIGNTTPIVLYNNSQSTQIQLLGLGGSKSYSETVRVACEINQNYGTQKIYADPNYKLSFAGHGPAVSASWGWSENSIWWLDMPGLVIPKEEFYTQWAWGDKGINLTNTITLTGQHVSVAIMDAFPNPSSTLTQTAILTHGIFVKGIVEHIAYNSEVIKAHVVNSSEYGDVFTLVTNLHELRSNRSEPMVINLSLGLHYPRRRCLTIGCSSVDRYALGTYGLPDDIIPLEKTLKWAYERNSVIVAAAGNISFPGEKIGYFTIPSDYDFVIGVASSNINGYPSCFSHPGDVYAPGGDGVGSNCDVLGGGKSPITDLDAIRPLSIFSKRKSENEDYTFWAGTSFSAPMVSGLAALLLEARVDSKDIPATIIRCAEQTGGGINIAYTLTHHQNPDCR